MTEAEGLREQAERYLRLARSATDTQIAEKLTALAAEYLDCAQTLERLAGPGPSATAPAQQPVQQQQQEQTKTAPPERGRKE
jgi:hypothetical protein